MDEKNPSFWKQYGPALAMGGCCLAPILIASAVNLAAIGGLGTLGNIGAVAALGGAGLYAWRRQARAGQAGTACCPAPEASAEKAAPAALPKEADVRRFTVGIGGMTCASCVNRIEQALTQVTGVVKASVSLETETATVEGRPGLDLAALAEAVRQAGYEPRLEEARR